MRPWCTRSDNKLPPNENSEFSLTTKRYIFQIFHFVLDYYETVLHLPIRGAKDGAAVKGLLDFSLNA